MVNYRWSNFHEYFPGGFYRKLNAKSDAKSKLTGDLDRVLSETGFDIKRFQQLIGRKGSVSRELNEVHRGLNGRELTPREQKREQRLDSEYEEVYQTLDRLLEPIYHRMRGLGYSHEDLVQ